MKKSLNPDRHYLADAVCCLLSVLFCMASVVFFSAFIAQDCASIKYPLEGPTANYNPYVQQFDAFRKGQAELDVEPAEGLAQLKNPYDYTERSRSGVYFLWDRAYYEGKYYSYFGITPVITVYYPYFMLHRELPGTGYVMTVLALIAAVFLPLAIWQYSRSFGRRIPHWALFFAAPALFWGSQIMLIARGRTPFYYVASVSGCAFLSAFLFFAFRAYGHRSQVKRCICYALAGLCYGLTFQSRLNIALMAAFVILPGLWFFIIGRERDKGIRKWTNIITELACLGAPVAVFVAGSMIFNSVRFSGPLDFGSAYQMTVADTSTYKLTLRDLPYALFHYIFALPQKSDVYPYLTFTYVRFNDYGHYEYIDAGMGLLASPIMYTLFLTPFVIFSKNYRASARTMIACADIGIICMALIDFCLGGVIYRYTCDMTVIGALTGIVTVFLIAERLGQIRGLKGSILRYALLGVFSAFLIFSAVRCIRLFLINDNGNVMEYDGKAAELVQRLFKFKAPEVTK